MASKKSNPNPHDSLFKATFSDPAEAASFLQAYLPADLVQSLDWATLKFEGFNYLDDALASSASDILFRIQTLDPDQELLLYLLFEHQSSPDKWMGFRFLKYENRIWDELFKKKPTPQILVPIIPIVFYQGERSWSYATKFSTLFTNEKTTNLDQYERFIPDFEYILIDHSGIEPAEIKGALKARITQLLMWAAYHQPIQEVLEIAARLLAQLPPSVGLNYLNIYVTYLSVTQEKETVTNFVETAQGQPVNIGGKMITAIEAWTQEISTRAKAEGMAKGEIKGQLQGEIKGEIKGQLQGQLQAKIAMIEGFLKTNISWDAITQATQIDPILFKNMKNIYANLVNVVTPKTAEIDADAEYAKGRRSMVVKILDHRFQLSEEQQSAELDNLATVHEKEELDELVNNALMVESLDMFHDHLSGLINSEKSSEVIG